MTTERFRLWRATGDVMLGGLCAVLGAYEVGRQAHLVLLVGRVDDRVVAMSAVSLAVGIVCLRLGFWRVVDAVTDWVMGGSD